MKESSLIQKINSEYLVLILQSWRLWLVGAIFGAVVGGLIYRFTPPAYQAEAIVSIDHNLEQAWQFPFDKSEFIFVGREAHKLEMVAWSDNVLSFLQSNSGQDEDIELFLDKTSEGAWGFYVTSSNDNESIKLVNLWVSNFVDEATKRIDTSFIIEKERFDLLKKISEDSTISLLEIEHEIKKVEELLNGYSGISPYIEISEIQVGMINNSYNLSISLFLFSGSLIGAVGFFFFAVFNNTQTKKND